MFLYLLTYFTNALSSFTNKRSSRVLNAFVFFLLVFISGTRYYMGGNDVYVYENVYNTTTSVNNILTYIFTGINNGVNENYEVGFQLICAISKAANLSYWGFILAYSIIFYSLMYKGLKPYSENWALLISVFMYKIMFYNTFISIRQGMTLAIFCYALHFIEEKKPFKYFLACFIAFYIHRGALILFPLYFLRNVQISKKRVICVATLFAPTWFIRETVNLGAVLEKLIPLIGMERKSDGWVEATEPINFLHTLECYLVISLIIIFYDRIVKENERAKLIIKLVLITVPIFTLFSNWIVMTREKDYFVLLYGIILGYICPKEISTKPQMLVELGTLAMCLVGLVRYALVFDGGVLKDFTSFIFKGCSIFS